jgi:hypothetical protein
MGDNKSIYKRFPCSAPAAQSLPLHLRRNAIDKNPTVAYSFLSVYQELCTFFPL